MLETAHDRAQPRGGPLRLYEQRARDELRRVVPVECGLEVLGAGSVRRVDREKPSVAIGGPQRGQQRGQQRDDNQCNHHLEALEPIRQSDAIICNHMQSDVIRCNQM